ncbi:DNA circularization protein [Ectopseudomonas mendocina]|uniref:DNA circulation N-terminal domain-containing protein n=1 Tax=Ectopseudomonas mendocina TaxID=300 RepID=A0A2R3QPD2_ECTME|nr:DNA circularization N-terminal domain-containing protein [Pseudomonas mendocina]AVO53645.1 hypothetical protein C7A17_12985 [Pseudomonas mendocina]
MSWRDRIDPELRGSYGGVPFYVTSSKASAGRRWTEEEKPNADGAFFADKGRAIKSWTLQLFVAGENYDEQRDKLLDALNAPGAAELVNPFLGGKPISAVATSVSFDERTSLGGMCEFTVTFKESGLPASLDTTLDTQREVGQAATLAEAVTEKDFLDRWSVEGLTGRSLASIEQALASEIDSLDQIAGGIAEEITQVIRFPMNIAGLVLGGYNRIRNAVMRPLHALNLYSGNSLLSLDGAAPLRLALGTPARTVRRLRELASAGSQVLLPAADSPESIRIAGNLLAASQLNGRLAATTAARVVAETDWLSRQDAAAAGRDALALIDRELKTAEPISDEVYNALVELRAALSNDLRTRALAIPNLTEYTPQLTLPALLVAHRLYGDAKRADEICVRNNVRHPGALRGGMTLEVLSE